jgi:hypothetical protein
MTWKMYFNKEKLYNRRCKKATAEMGDRRLGGSGWSEYRGIA